MSEFAKSHLLMAFCPFLPITTTMLSDHNLLLKFQLTPGRMHASPMEFTIQMNSKLIMETDLITFYLTQQVAMLCSHLYLCFQNKICERPQNCPRFLAYMNIRRY